VVASTYYRGWYGPGDELPSDPSIADTRGAWSRYRIRGDFAGVVSESDWMGMDAFERNCWFWAWWNDLIEHSLRECESRSFFVRLEQLQENTSALLSFLDVSTADLRPEKLNAAKYSVKRWTSWSEEQRQCFEKWCGTGMDKWYPGWRTTDGRWTDWPTR
jgi:hypothetical protein